MAILNHFNSLAIPFILLFSIPLLLLASFTSFLAISLLAFRVLIIYVELGVAVIPYYLSPFPSSSSSGIKQIPPYASLAGSPTLRRRRRASSISLSAQSSAISSSSLTPVASTLQILNTQPTQQPVSGLKPSVSTSAIVNKAPNPLALTSSAFNPYLSKTPTRDFEGVGGWRLDAPDDEDALWTKINSRLELPAEHGRRHRRSTTAGSVKYRDGVPVREGMEQLPALEREDSGLVGWGSGTRSVRSGSPEAERERVIGGAAAWERERESNVGRARTPAGSGESVSYFGGSMPGVGGFGGSPTSPRNARGGAAKREQSAHTVASMASTSSGSSRGSGLSMKPNH